MFSHFKDFRKKSILLLILNQLFLIAILSKSLVSTRVKSADHYPSSKSENLILNRISNFANLPLHVQDSVLLFINWDDTDKRKQKLDKLFSTFITKKKLLYSSPREEKYRRQVFEDNMFKASSHNVEYAIGKQTFHLGITKFADLTDKEFLNQYTTKIGIPQNNDKSLSPLKSVKKIKKTEQKISTKATANYPNSVDFRKRGGVINPVENQGQCGSCYSFATVAATEAAWALQTERNDTPILSKQEMVDCGKLSSSGLNGCQGGILQAAYRYLQKYGVSKDSEYPYTQKEGKCESYKFKPAVQISDFSMLTDVSKDAFLSMLYKQPVSIAVQMLPQFKLYKGGIVDIKGPCGFFYNHAILAVGYSLETKDNKTPSHIILKNTYGTDWGEEGYMLYKMGVGPAGMCAYINSNNSIPIM